MTIAYLILTHQNPLLLSRTIRTLSVGCEEQVHFFIHVDLKADLAPFSVVRGANIQFIDERIAVYWGEHSQVDAYLAMMREAIDHPKRFDYCVLLDAACYPLKTGGYIKQYFEANRGAEFMDLVRVPAPGKPISRFDTIRFPSSDPIRRRTYQALAKIGLAQRDHRKYLKEIRPYSGEGTCALSRKSCKYLLEFDATHPEIREFFRHTFCSVESYFHTVLGNSEFCSNIRRNVVYTVWPGPKNGHPAMIGEEQLLVFARETVWRKDRCGQVEMLFARKFDDHRLDVVDQVDAIIESKEGVSLKVEIRHGYPRDVTKMDSAVLS